MLLWVLFLLPRVRVCPKPSLGHVHSHLLAHILPDRLVAVVAAAGVALAVGQAEGLRWIRAD